MAQQIRKRRRYRALPVRLDLRELAQVGVVGGNRLVRGFEIQGFHKPMPLFSGIEKKPRLHTAGERFFMASQRMFPLALESKHDNPCAHKQDSEPLPDRWTLAKEYHRNHSNQEHA
jgi:hypothetical protein